MAQKLNIDIVARDRTKQALGGVQGALGRLKRSVFSLQTAFIGLGAGLVARNLVQTGKNLENLRTRLKFLLKDTNEGAKAFDNMVKFASKVPFSLEEIQSGSGILATVTDNANDLQKMLEITGNVAAVTGLDFRTASEQIQRSFSAGIGAADLFREKGVRNMLGFKAGATVSIEETVEAFERVFGRDGRFGQATDELAGTFEGTLSMIGDKIFNFKKVLLEAGLFEELKRQFGDLDQFLEDNGKQIDELAKKIGKGLGIAFKGLADTIVFLKENINGVVTVLSGLIALKVATFFHGVTTAIAGMTVAMNGFNLATKRNIIFGSIMVFASAMGFLIHKFKEFKGELNTELPTFKELNEDIKELEQRLANSGRASKVAIREQLKIKKSQLEQLETESGLLHHHNTSHMRKKHLQLGILENQKEITEETKKVFNIFESHHQLVKAVTEAEKRRSDNLIGTTRNIADETQRHINLLKELKEQKLEELEEQRIEKIREEGTALENLKENYREFFENFNAGTEIANIFQNSLQSVTKGIGDAIAQTIVFGKSFKETFGNIARNILAQLISSLVQVGINMVLNATIGKKLQAASVASGVASAAVLSAAYATPAALASLASFGTNAIPAQSALISTVALSNVLSSVKGFEKGGAVAKGQPVLVGERGAEMFVPNSTGQITQSARGTGGEPVTVNFNINAVDASGFEELLVRSRGTITQLINSAVNERGREALI